MSEKQESGSGTLPTTNIDNGTDLQERRKQWKLRRLVAFGFILFTFWHGGEAVRSLYNSHISGDVSRVSVDNHSDVLQGYMDKLTGARPVQVSSWAHKDKHEKHGKHHHKDHKDHKDKHGKGKHGHEGKEHGHPGPSKWISPKEAEEIFLTVPSNDSLRALVTLTIS